MEYERKKHRLKVSPCVDYYWDKYSDGARIGRKGLASMLKEINDDYIKSLTIAIEDPAVLAAKKYVEKTYERQFIHDNESHNGSMTDFIAGWHSNKEK